MFQIRFSEFFIFYFNHYRNIPKSKKTDSVYTALKKNEKAPKQIRVSVRSAIFEPYLIDNSLNKTIDANKNDPLETNIPEIWRSRIISFNRRVRIGYIGKKAVSCPILTS